MNIRSDLFGYALEIGRPLRTSCISCGDLRDDPLGVQLLWGPPRHIRTQHVQEPAPPSIRTRSTWPAPAWCGRLRWKCQTSKAFGRRA